MSEAIELKKELEKSLLLLQTLRDEVRVKLHLAGMDAKDKWSEIESQLVAAEHAAAAATTEATRVTVDEAIKKLQNFRSLLH